jgi:hypothetical protein
MKRWRRRAAQNLWRVTSTLHEALETKSSTKLVACDINVA